ncbi:MAG TPA: phosphohistidine phosphatase SixA [Leptospiraceae bacterium]|jgi:phosphohistidine phosphatase|nr:phosphohistidine phosphatase SixA [Leptospirales bacterium]HMU81819.1 phosphohistidine phosphatase SixA [Leptospiraceae bacterium]HMX54916.1 phosphohistidine phosphatase SixA [Leptospiraceae bacterium]HMZ35480.1 phosphohistidine phosphatase SixA [Leptospiraceae bacterium]HNE22900.1 phosphohistidine phosphatase SixA [Leptospiraceae bacterium]
MKLLLARHAEAESSTPDSERSLTEKGKSDARRMARVLRQTGWQFEEILCSPLRRTVQTAELYGAGLGTSAKNAVQAVPFLAPTADRTRAIEHLGEMGIRGAALWVFHMPDVAEVASWLLGIPAASLYVTPGTIIALNLAFPVPGKAMLVWSMQPEHLPE